jgi:hypothetical protein
MLGSMNDVDAVDVYTRSTANLNEQYLIKWLFNDFIEMLGSNIFNPYPQCRESSFQNKF